MKSLTLTLITLLLLYSCNNSVTVTGEIGQAWLYTNKVETNGLPKIQVNFQGLICDDSTRIFLVFDKDSKIMLPQKTEYEYGLLFPVYLSYSDDSIGSIFSHLKYEVQGKRIESPSNKYSANISRLHSFERYPKKADYFLLVKKITWTEVVTDGF